MPLNKDEIDRLAEDMLADRIIVYSSYCAGCGYNLRLRPYEGSCPECGAQYNARPLKMKGIFLPQMLEFPILDLLGFVVCAFTAFVLIGNSLSPFQSGPVYLGVLVTFVAIIFAQRAYRELRLFVKFRHVAKRIESGECE